MNVEKLFPNAVFGCGHLGPMGWCVQCITSTELSEERRLARRKALEALSAVGALVKGLRALEMTHVDENAT